MIETSVLKTDSNEIELVWLKVTNYRTKFLR